MCENKFYVCGHCGNIVGLIKNAGVPLMCCGQKMTLLEPGTVEASHEKHIPVVKVNDGIVEVNIGSVDHPMTEEHLIKFIAVETKEGSQIKFLTAADKPHAEFALSDTDELVAVYEYCNLHGLWKK